MNAKFFAIVMVALGTAQCVSVADAATRRLTVNASGACQSALPVFDVQIRKRPLAVQNEGTAAAFISCSYYSIGPWGLGFGQNAAFVYASTNDGVADTVTCLGVNGYNGGSAIYVPKTVDLPADGSYAIMIWNASDFSDDEPTFPYSNLSISCNLNPGVGINEADLFFDDGT